MITAEREHLEDLMQQEAVSIRIKEERVLRKTFQNLSQLSTYLAAADFAIIQATPTYLKSYDSYLDATHINLERSQSHGGFRDQDSTMTIFLVTLTTGFAAIAIGCFVMVRKAE